MTAAPPRATAGGPCRSCWSAPSWPCSTPRSSTWPCRASARGCSPRRPAWSGSWPATHWPTAWPWCPPANSDRFGHKPLFLIGLTIFTWPAWPYSMTQRRTDRHRPGRAGVRGGVYHPAISATIQLSFTGQGQSRAFGVLGATIGVSTAIGPLLGGLIIAAAGARDGWRWVFLVNLFIGVVTVPLAAWLLPGGRTRTRRGFDPVGLGLLTAGAAAVADPAGRGAANRLARLVLGLLRRVRRRRPSCWPPGRYRKGRRGGDPLLKPGLLGGCSFSARRLLRGDLLRRLCQRVLHPVDPVAGRPRAQRADHRPGPRTVPRWAA